MRLVMDAYAHATHVSHVAVTSMAHIAVVHACVIHGEEFEKFEEVEEFDGGELKEVARRGRMSQSPVSRCARRCLSVVAQTRSRASWDLGVPNGRELKEWESAYVFKRREDDVLVYIWLFNRAVLSTLSGRLLVECGCKLVSWRVTE